MTPDRHYAARLDIARPRVEDFVRRRDVKLFHLMVIALLERGEPMTLDEIARRLKRAGVTHPHADLDRSLLKAWHGLAPVHRDPGGKFGLDLASRELDFLLMVTDLSPRRFHAAEPPPPAPPPPLGDDVPLSIDEVQTAFLGRWLGSISPLRLAAAVLDAADCSLTLAEIDSLLATLTPHRPRITPDGARFWRSAMVSVDAQGRATLDRRATGVAEMRRTVRALGVRATRERAEEERMARLRAEMDARHAADMELARAHASVARRVILHAVPSATSPEAIGLLDVESRAMRIFPVAELEALNRELATYHVLAALQARELLHTLGHDPNAWRVVDLGPPQKTVRLNQRGRVLRLSAPLLITGTTGQSRPLSDPVHMRAYLAAGDRAKLRRRIEADLKALYAFYRYGVLHGWVRLRWGFLDDRLSVDWALRGDVSLYEIFDDAVRRQRPVDVVMGSAPGWQEPWARARRVEVIQAGYDRAVLRDGTDTLVVDYADIHAARPVT